MFDLKTYLTREYIQEDCAKIIDTLITILNPEILTQSINRTFGSDGPRFKIKSDLFGQEEVDVENPKIKPIAMNIHNSSFEYFGSFATGLFCLQYANGIIRLRIINNTSSNNRPLNLVENNHSFNCELLTFRIDTKSGEVTKEFYSRRTIDMFIKAIRSNSRYEHHEEFKKSIFRLFDENPETYSIKPDHTNTRQVDLENLYKIIRAALSTEKNMATFLDKFLPKKKKPKATRNTFPAGQQDENYLYNVDLGNYQPNSEKKPKKRK